MNNVRHLVLDIGNTRTKYGYFDNGLLQASGICVNWSVAQWDAFYQAHPFQTVFVGSVGVAVKSVLSKLPTAVKIQSIDETTKYPFTSAYNDLNALGIDRRAGLAGAMYCYPKKAVLIIDAGSCITYDFISAKGHHHGGAISPGRAMRYKAMHLFTANLPLLEPDESNPSYGTTTQESMKAGVETGIIAEIQAQIDVFAQHFGNFTIILTGGDADFLIKKIKNTIFADTDLILKGLYHLLMYNSLHE